jgi:hypothetical protein
MWHNCITQFSVSSFLVSVSRTVRCFWTAIQCTSVPSWLKQCGVRPARWNTQFVQTQTQTLRSSARCLKFQFLLHRKHIVFSLCSNGIEDSGSLRYDTVSLHHFLPKKFEAFVLLNLCRLTQCATLHEKSGNTNLATQGHIPEDPHSQSAFPSEGPSTCLQKWLLHMEASRGRRGAAPLILNLGTTWKWVVSFTFRPYYFQCPLNRRMNGFHGQSQYFVEVKNLLPLLGIESRIFQPLG